MQNFSFNIMFTIPPNVTKNTMLSILLLTTANLRHVAFTSIAMGGKTVANVIFASQQI